MIISGPVPSLHWFVLLPVWLRRYIILLKKQFLTTMSNFLLHFTLLFHFNSFWEWHQKHFILSLLLSLLQLPWFFLFLILSNYLHPIRYSPGLVYWALLSFVPSSILLNPKPFMLRINLFLVSYSLCRSSLRCFSVCCWLLFILLVVNPMTGILSFPFLLYTFSLLSMKSILFLN